MTEAERSRESFHDRLAELLRVTEADDSMGQPRPFDYDIRGYDYSGEMARARDMQGTNPMHIFGAEDTALIDEFLSQMKARAFPGAKTWTVLGNYIMPGHEERRGVQYDTRTTKAYLIGRRQPSKQEKNRVHPFRVYICSDGRLRESHLGSGDELVTLLRLGRVETGSFSGSQPSMVPSDMDLEPSESNPIDGFYPADLSTTLVNIKTKNG